MPNNSPGWLEQLLNWWQENAGKPQPQSYDPRFYNPSRFGMLPIADADLARYNDTAPAHGLFTRDEGMLAVPRPGYDRLGDPGVTLDGNMVVGDRIPPRQPASGAEDFWSRLGIKPAGKRT